MIQLTVVQRFEANDPRQLSVSEGSVVELIDANGQKEWWLVRDQRRNLTGLVPATHLETPEETEARRNSLLNQQMALDVIVDSYSEARREDKRVEFDHATSLKQQVVNDQSDDKSETFFSKMFSMANESDCQLKKQYLRVYSGNISADTRSYRTIQVPECLGMDRIMPAILERFQDGMQGQMYILNMVHYRSGLLIPYDVCMSLAGLVEFAKWLTVMEMRCTNQKLSGSDAGARRLWEDHHVALKSMMKTAAQRYVVEHGSHDTHFDALFPYLAKMLVMGGLIDRDETTDMVTNYKFVLHRNVFAEPLVHFYVHIMLDALVMREIESSSNGGESRDQDTTIHIKVDNKMTCSQLLDLCKDQLVVNDVQLMLERIGDNPLVLKPHLQITCIYQMQNFIDPTQIRLLLCKISC